MPLISNHLEHGWSLAFHMCFILSFSPSIEYV